MLKRIKVKCFDPMAIDPEARQPWSDVWISFKGKPGRKRYYYGLTLCTHKDAEAELKAISGYKADSPDLYREEEISEIKSILSELEHADIYIDNTNPGYPSIYTKAEFIDRPEAEKMLVAFLGKLGYKLVKFIWKRPGILVIPAGS